MSEFLTLQAQKRDKTGKGVARRLRATGLVPAVFYTAHGESQPIQLNQKDLTKVYGAVGRTKVFNVEVEADGAKKVYPALFWDIDYYPTKNLIQHVDIFGVDLDKEIKIRVPLEFVGTAKGTKIGGKLEVFLETVEVAAKPLSLPPSIQVDISELGINQSVKVGDIALPGGVSITNNPNLVVVNVSTGKSGAGEEGEQD